MAEFDVDSLYMRYAEELLQDLHHNRVHFDAVPASAHADWPSRFYMDPYVPPKAEARLDKLRDARYDKGIAEASEDRAWWFLPALVTTVILTIVGCSMGWPTWGWFIALSPLTVPPLTWLALGIHGHAKEREKRALESKYGSGQHSEVSALNELARNLYKLPLTDRAELYDLWTTAHAAGEVLKQDPTNARAKAIIEDRLSVVEDILKERARAEEELRTLAKHEQIAALTSSLPQGDSDLQNARHMLESLGEGTESIRRLRARIES